MPYQLKHRPSRRDRPVPQVARVRYDQKLLQYELAISEALLVRKAQYLIPL